MKATENFALIDTHPWTPKYEYSLPTTYLGLISLLCGHHLWKFHKLKWAHHFMNHYDMVRSVLCNVPKWSLDRRQGKRVGERGQNICGIPHCGRRRKISSKNLACQCVLTFYKLNFSCAMLYTVIASVHCSGVQINFLKCEIYWWKWPNYGDDFTTDRFYK